MRRPPRFSREWVHELASRYEYADDDAAIRAGTRAASRGFYSRDDFLAVVGWKSLRSVPLARQNSVRDIEAATCAALDPLDESHRLRSLTHLRGVQVPVASALLHFALPEIFPILDYRALASPGDHKRRTQYSTRFWLEYVARCQQLADRAGVSIRELDKALWQDSRESDSGRR